MKGPEGVRSRSGVRPCRPGAGNRVTTGSGVARALGSGHFVGRGNLLRPGTRIGGRGHVDGPVSRALRGSMAGSGDINWISHCGWCWCFRMVEVGYRRRASFAEDARSHRAPLQRPSTNTGHKHRARTTMERRGASRPHHISQNFSTRPQSPPSFKFQRRPKKRRQNNVHPSTLSHSKPDTVPQLPVPVRTRSRAGQMLTLFASSQPDCPRVVENRHFGDAHDSDQATSSCHRARPSSPDSVNIGGGGLCSISKSRGPKTSRPLRTARPSRDRVPADWFPRLPQPAWHCPATCLLSAQCGHTPYNSKADERTEQISLPSPDGAERFQSTVHNQAHLTPRGLSLARWMRSCLPSVNPSCQSRNTRAWMMDPGCRPSGRIHQYENSCRRRGLRRLCLDLPLPTNSAFSRFIGSPLRWFYPAGHKVSFHNVSTKPVSYHPSLSQ
ncbi:hypothetical protein QBC39DRAFT_44659 [Podospora conica]|nr:hypothetical protein QBC39DRAFT_44659 [Schizothecium conicum]